MTLRSRLIHLMWKDLYGFWSTPTHLPLQRLGFLDIPNLFPQFSKNVLKVFLHSCWMHYHGWLEAPNNNILKHQPHLVWVLIDPYTFFPSKTGIPRLSSLSSLLKLATTFLNSPRMSWRCSSFLLNALPPPARLNYDTNW